MVGLVKVSTRGAGEALANFVGRPVAKFPVTAKALNHGNFRPLKLFWILRTYFFLRRFSTFSEQH
jgi:hypothetical protein